MSYYIGFRHGWVWLFGHYVSWHDTAYYPYLPYACGLGPWKVWFK